MILLESSNKDSGWNEAFNTIFWEKVTSKKIDMISEKFDHWIFFDDFNKTETNWWTITESNSRLLVQSSTTVNWQAIFETKDVVRYRPWHEIFAFFTYGWLDWWIIWAKQFIWNFNTDNGYYVGFNDEDFIVWRRISWVDNEQHRIDFLDKLDWIWNSVFTIDFTKINIFRITFWYLWIAPAIFQVYWWSKLWWITFAIIDIINVSTELAIESPNLPIRVEIIKTSWVTNIRWVSWSWEWWYHNWWDFNVWNRSNHYDTWLWESLTWTWVENVIAFRLKSTFNWKSNKATAQLVHWDFNNDATWDIIVMNIVANPDTIWGTVVWSLSYTDIDTNNSMVEYKAAWWVVVWWKTIYTQYMIWWGWWSWAFAWWWSIAAEELWLLWRPWDIFAVTYTRISWTWGYKALMNMNWIELF